MTLVIDRWLADQLVCPRDHGPLTATDAALACPLGHRYPIVDGVPIMLVDDVPQTFGAAKASMSRAAGNEGDHRAPGLFLESVEISDEEKARSARTRGATARHRPGGFLPRRRDQRHDVQTPGRPTRVLSDSRDRSSARSGPPHARRGLQLGPVEHGGRAPRLPAYWHRPVARCRNGGTPGRASAWYRGRVVVGDARYLPFRQGSFETVFSYSVLQHFSRPDARRAIAEIGRVLMSGGTSRVQMPTRYGLRCLYHQARRGFSDGHGFEVRYWTPADLIGVFSEHVGQARLDVDGYFGIGLQQTDAHLMTGARRLVLRASHLLTLASRRLPWLTRVADSVYVNATRS